MHKPFDLNKDNGGVEQLAESDREGKATWPSQPAAPERFLEFKKKS